VLLSSAVACKLEECHVDVFKQILAMLGELELCEGAGIRCGYASGNVRCRRSQGREVQIV
jgi:hypothetical protein